MKSRTLLGLALSLGVLASCSGDDQRFESTLTFPKARNIIVNEDNPARREYGLRQLDRLANSGETRATRFLARSYAQGVNGLPQDPERAAQYFEISRAGGDPRATPILIRLYSDVDGAAYNPDRVIELLTEDYEAGDNEAGLKLADFIENQEDGQRAQEIRSALITRGSDDAQIDFASALMDEENPSYDPNRAIALYEELAADENPRALRELGLIYMRGVVVERDRQQAYDYFQRGAAVGDDTSSLFVAIIQLIPSEPVYDEERGYERLNDLARQGVTGAWVQLANRDPERYVMAMQQVLRDANFYQGPPTGEVDALTVQALVQYCPENNVAGDCTLDPLGRDLARALARTARNS